MKHDDEQAQRGIESPNAPSTNKGGRQRRQFSDGSFTVGQMTSMLAGIRRRRTDSRRDRQNIPNNQRLQFWWRAENWDGGSKNNNSTDR